jgi:hypothetical protein
MMTAATAFGCEKMKADSLADLVRMDARLHLAPTPKAE